MRCAPLVGCGILVLGGWVVSVPVHAGELKLGDIVKEVLETLDKITTSLTTVKDEATAKAAVPDLRKGVARFKELRDMAGKAKPPSTEEKNRLKKEYKEKLEKATAKAFAEIARVKKVPGGAEALKEINLVFKKEK
jgi:hypothetical protein